MPRMRHRSSPPATCSPPTSRPGRVGDRDPGREVLEPRHSARYRHARGRQPHLVISATDAAGNVTTETLIIAVHATVQGLVAAVDYGVAKGYITSSTAASALETALAKAQSAITANMTATAITDLKQFLSDLAKDKKVIKPFYAALLTGWASDLITRL